MSLINQNKISFLDSPAIDASARLRVSSLHSVFSSKLLYDKQPLLWDEQITGTFPTSTHSVDEACVKMTVGTSSGDKIIRQTKFRFNHQPGRSQVVLVGGTMGVAKNNVRKRWGYFDTNNGIFFEQDGTGLKTVIRSKESGTVVDTAIAQTDWNLDKMDGSGESGITINLSKIQLFIIDFDWIGTGRVRMGFVIDGMPAYCHQFVHANSISGVYMSTPNLPIRLEIENTGVSASATELKQVACCIMSEGGYGQNTTTRSVDCDNNYKYIGTTPRPIISIRLKNTHKSAMVVPAKISIMANDTKDFRYMVCINPTISGGTGASWVDVPNSAIQYDKSRTGSITNEGIVIDSGYTTMDILPLTIDLASDYILGTSISGVSDEVVVAAQTMSSNDDFCASIGWKEHL